MDLNGKLSLVTGGSSGIGLALSKKLAAQGSHVWIFARDPIKLDAACQEISAIRLNPNQKIGSTSVDITQFDQVATAANNVISQVGVPDFLFNSAGISQPGYFAEQELDIFRKTMEVNYFGTLYVSKVFLPGMLQRGSGHIINISSVAGFMGVYGYSAYGPSKFAVRGLSDVMRYELADQGIHVSVVFPPDTQTPQLEYENKFKPPVLVELDKSNKIMSAGAVADAILAGVARGRYVITPGFDSSLYYQLTNFFGLVYPAMDFMVSQARRAVQNSGRNSATKNDSSH